MIKPWQILDIRQEPDGGKTVTFKVYKVDITSIPKSIKTMETAVYVAAHEDVEDTLYNYLKESGWIDA